MLLFAEQHCKIGIIIIIILIRQVKELRLRKFAKDSSKLPLLGRRRPRMYPVCLTSSFFFFFSFPFLPLTLSRWSVLGLRYRRTSFFRHLPAWWVLMTENGELCDRSQARFANLSQVVNTALCFSVTSVLALCVWALEGQTLLQDSDVRPWLQCGVEDRDQGQPLSWIGGFFHTYSI